MHLKNSCRGPERSGIMKVWRNKLIDSELAINDPKISSQSRQFWVCFGGCIWNGAELGQDSQEYMVTKIARNDARKKSFENARYNTETERRIKEWILDSSLCYDQASEISCHRDANNLQIFDEGGDGLERSDSAASAQSDRPLIPVKVTSDTERGKERNRNRWKGRLPADPAEALSIAIPTDEYTASQDIRVKLPAAESHCRSAAQPQPLCADTTSRLSGRVIVMRHRVLLQGRRPSSRYLC